MLIRIGYDIVFKFPVPTPMLLMLNTNPSEAHRVTGEDRPRTEPELPMSEFIDGFGNRCNRIVAPAGRLRLRSEAFVTDSGQHEVIATDAPQAKIEDLPDECLTFLLGSRYCEVAEMLSIAWDLFGQTPTGGARVQAICGWLFSHVEFGYQYARSSKTALDVFTERRGVCRDFAHLAVTFCRCMNIPARYCNGYLGDIGVPPDVNPMDFSAWFEVYLGDRWHTFDARHNEPRIGRVLLTRGRDATDVAMTTAFGSNTLEQFIIVAEEVPEA